MQMSAPRPPVIVLDRFGGAVGIEGEGGAEPCAMARRRGSGSTPSPVAPERARRLDDDLAGHAQAEHRDGVADADAARRARRSARPRRYARRCRSAGRRLRQQPVARIVRAWRVVGAVAPGAEHAARRGAGRLTLGPTSTISPTSS